MKHSGVIETLYLYLMSRVTGVDRTKRKPAVEIQAEKMLKWVRKDYPLFEDQLGKHFFFHFLCYGFASRYFLLKRHDLKPAPTWCIGKKAWDTYKNRDKEKDYIVTAFRKENKVSVDDYNRYVQSYFPSFQKGEPFVDLEELARAKHLNEPSGLGLGNCYLTTTMYNKKSKSCSVCLFTESCKKLQATKYPIISHDRSNPVIKIEPNQKF